MKRLLPVLAVACIALVGGVSAAFANGSGGVTVPSIYVNGVLYRTVGTPTDFSNTGAPDSSFETIYDFGGVQPNVAEAAPGDPASAADAGRCTRFPSTRATPPPSPRTTRTAAATSTARPRSTRPLPIRPGRRDRSGRGRAVRVPCYSSPLAAHPVGPGGVVRPARPFEMLLSGKPPQPRRTSELAQGSIPEHWPRRATIFDVLRVPHCLMGTSSTNS